MAITNNLEAPVSRDIGTADNSNIVAFNYQTGARDMASIRNADVMPAGFRPAEDVITAQGQDDSTRVDPTRDAPHQTSSPERMEAANFFSDTVKAYKNKDGNSLTEEQRNALYRTLMDKYCVDDYASSAQQDAEILKQAGITPKEISAMLKKASDSNIPGGSRCAIS